MKVKNKKGLSIRNRIILWFLVTIVLILSLTLSIVWLISKNILEKSTRDYLISLVEENSDSIIFRKKKELAKAKKIDPNDIYIRYKKGYLQIDDDFLDIVNEVQSGLYTSDGILLYGKNPIYKETIEENFTISKVLKTKIGKDSYYLYDRKVTVEGTEGLWIRGVAPLNLVTGQMKELFSLLSVFLPVLLLITLFFGLFVSKMIRKPLKDMEATALEIASGNNLKLRLHTSNTNDEISHLASIINTMLDRIEKLFLAEKEFTSDASHELRTPAAVITAQLEYALEKNREKEDYINILRVIDRQSRRMNHLIHDLLSYTRLDKRIDEYKMSTLSFSTMVENTCSDLEPLKIKNISLETEIEKELVFSGNYELLERMLVNLIENAYKYGKENGYIRVKLQKNSSLFNTYQKERGLNIPYKLCLSVIDNGVGISKENQKHIFNRFYRGENTREKGNGLGLSIVKRIVEIHKGSILVDSKEGEGSIFFVIF